MSHTNPSISTAPQTLFQVVEQAYAQASQGKLSLIDLINAAQQLGEAKHFTLAIQLYRLWIEHTDSPVSYIAQFNLAVLLSNCNDDNGAELAYRAAISQKPTFIEGNLNLGTLLERLGRPEEALDLWRNVLTIIDQNVPSDLIFYIQALNNLGRLLEVQKQLPEAEAMLTESLKQNPDQPNVITHWIHLRQKLCKWPVFSNTFNIPTENLIAGTSALAMLSAFDDPKLQLETASRYVEQKVLKGVRYLSSKQSYGHKRLRIGYLSSDFCSHAVSILTAELYGLHDRTKFEVFGFCWSHEDGSPLRARVISGMDQHIKIGTLSDEAAAQLIRSHEIDILVDLNGLTLGTRHNILAYRPAPVQITWLGFPGTTAQPEIDYVLSDPFVLPPELEPFFTEKPLHMPHTFQINDRQRIIGPCPSRESCQLPEDSFVFCSFNNTYKLTPEVFEAWLRILKRVPNSILWLVADNDTVRENLIKYALEQGIDSKRIHFAERVAPSEYLARFQVADLFLDTFPFGAGTTASDALWAGLPVLTRAGRTFASRMAGSLLQAVKLPELITYDLKDYEDKAVELALQPQRIEIMKQQLVENRLSCKLFDSPSFVRDFEALCTQVIEQLPSAPKQSNVIDVDLSYIKSPLDLNIKDRRYVIVAPPFQHNSAGIRVLYDLQKWLVLAGLDAIVCTWFQGYPLEQFANDIVIYPEVVPGNLLNAKRVIRYILNVPGKLGHGEKTYDPSEVLVAYNQELAHYANGVMLQVPSIEPFFYSSDCEKPVNAVFVGKGQDLGLHPADCIAITKSYPETRRQLADLLRTVKTLFIYDDFSMIAQEARLCGCELILIKSDGAFVDYPLQNFPTLEEFKLQLHEFIEMTKKL
ncbi:tetratricopeptide repeat protein [Methylomonas sp. AM2-LC]|uniref:O-linked N-acetylglucosamine transferase family protein n=1 Tax=Methylomonas sp. AM2-LC TaxID=3153301 RepID=UPI0032667A13